MIGSNDWSMLLTLLIYCRPMGIFASRREQLREKMLEAHTQGGQRQRPAGGRNGPAFGIGA